MKVTKVLRNKYFSTIFMLLLLDFKILFVIISIYRRFKKFVTFFKKIVTGQNYKKYKSLLYKEIKLSTNLGLLLLQNWDFHRKLLITLGELVLIV
jgi:hypothetical protein